MPNHVGILNYRSGIALVHNRKFILVKAKSFQGSEHDINLGLPFKIVLNPEPKDFGFVYIFKLVRSDTQVYSMWRGLAKFDLKSLAFLGIEIEPII